MMMKCMNCIVSVGVTNVQANYPSGKKMKLQILFYLLTSFSNI
jgi:hypothetical protein